MGSVILPQAWKIALAPTVGYLVQLIKGTSLAAIIGFTELTRTGQIINNATFQPMLVFGMVAPFYFPLCWPLSLMAARIEAPAGRRAGTLSGAPVSPCHFSQTTTRDFTMIKRPGRFTLGTLAVQCFMTTALVAASFQSAATDLIASTNDAKYQRVVGKDTFLENPQPDTLDIIDASHFPPRVVASVNVAAAIQGPPQAVAITPDGKLAIVSAPSRYDTAEKKLLLENYLQVVDLTSSPASVIAKVDIAHHPQAIAINRAGNLLLATTTSGHLLVFAIDGKSITLKDTLKLSDKRLAGITITPDGKTALVALRDEQGLMVLDIDSDKVTTQRERISTGVAPYSVDVSSTGKWALVGNAGLAGLPGTWAPGGRRRFHHTD